MYDKMVIAFDQSYTNTGISIWAGNKGSKPKCVNVGAISFKPGDTHIQKRLAVKAWLLKAIAKCQQHTDNIIVLTEQIRVFNGGSASMAYIGVTHALVGCIADTAYEHGIKTYAVDTRSWKSKVVGDVKPKANKYYVDPKKWPTVQYVINEGYEAALLKPVSNRCKHYAKIIDGVKYVYVDDISDAYCIGKYGFVQGRVLNKIT